MTQENNENEFVSADAHVVEEEYLEISQQAETRAVELPKEGTAVKSMSEAMDEATDLTDMQFAAAHLFPKNVGINDVMIGRVAPDAFLALLHIMVTNEVMTADPSLPIDVNKIIMQCYVRLTIGLHGEGRVDYAELLGAAKEIRKEESLLKSI